MELNTHAIQLKKLVPGSGIEPELTAPKAAVLPIAPPGNFSHKNTQPLVSNSEFFNCPRHCTCARNISRALRESHRINVALRLIRAEPIRSAISAATSMFASPHNTVLFSRAARPSVPVSPPGAATSKCRRIFSNPTGTSFEIPRVPRKSNRLPQLLRFDRFLFPSPRPPSGR